MAPLQVLETKEGRKVNVLLCFSRPRPTGDATDATFHACDGPHAKPACHPSCKQPFPIPRVTDLRGGTATMSSTGVDVKDLLPIPHNTEAITNDQDGETSNTLAEPPTGEWS